MLLVSVYLILSFALIVVSFSPFVFLFRCVLHPLPLPLSSCLGCIPPLIGLATFPAFYAVVSSLFLLTVYFCLCFSILSRRCPLLATFLSVLFCLLSLLISDFRFDLVWFRLSRDHGWIRSGSVNVRQTTATTTGVFLCRSFIRRYKLYVLCGISQSFLFLPVARVFDQNRRRSVRLTVMTIITIILILPRFSIEREKESNIHTCAVEDRGSRMCTQRPPIMIYFPTTMCYSINVLQHLQYVVLRALLVRHNTAI